MSASIIAQSSERLQPTCNNYNDDAAGSCPISNTDVKGGGAVSTVAKPSQRSGDPLHHASVKLSHVLGSEAFFTAQNLASAERPSSSIPNLEPIPKHCKKSDDAGLVTIVPYFDAIADTSGTEDTREWLGRIEVAYDGRWAKLVQDGAVVSLDDGEITHREQLTPNAADYEQSGSGESDTRLGVLATLDSANNGTKAWRDAPAKRGVVTGFSKKSRKRLLDIFNKLNSKMLTGDAVCFLTFTYGDDFPVDNPDRWRADFEKFRRRMERHYNDTAPRWCGVWRMELKRRQSGENAGQVAPHYHMLLFNMKHGRPISDFMLKAELLSWLPDAWAEISGASSQGTDIKIESNWYRISKYVSKYIAKVEAEDANAPLPDGVRRMWGFLHAGKNKENLPWAAVIVGYISSMAQKRVMGMFRHINHIPDDAPFKLPSISAYLHPAWFIDWLEEEGITVEWAEGAL